MSSHRTSGIAELPISVSVVPLVQCDDDMLETVRRGVRIAVGCLEGNEEILQPGSSDVLNLSEQDRRFYEVLEGLGSWIRKAWISQHVWP